MEELIRQQKEMLAVRGREGGKDREKERERERNTERGGGWGVGGGVSRRHHLIHFRPAGVCLALMVTTMVHLVVALWLQR
jgi:hypothetical protein